MKLCTMTTIAQMYPITRPKASPFRERYPAQSARADMKRSQRPQRKMAAEQAGRKVVHSCAVGEV